MFFVSEEFLRKHQDGEDFVQTIGEVVPPGEELFDNIGGKKAHKNKKRDNWTESPRLVLVSSFIKLNTPTSYSISQLHVRRCKPFQNLETRWSKKLYLRIVTF